MNLVSRQQLRCSSRLLARASRKLISAERLHTYSISGRSLLLLLLVYRSELHVVLVVQLGRRWVVEGLSLESTGAHCSFWRRWQQARRLALPSRAELGVPAAQTSRHVEVIDVRLSALDDLGAPALSLIFLATVSHRSRALFSTTDLWQDTRLHAFLSRRAIS